MQRMIELIGNNYDRSCTALKIFSRVSCEHEQGCGGVCEVFQRRMNLESNQIYECSSVLGSANRFTIGVSDSEPIHSGELFHPSLILKSIIRLWLLVHAALSHPSHIFSGGEDAEKKPNAATHRPICQCLALFLETAQIGKSLANWKIHHERMKAGALLRAVVTNDLFRKYIVKHSGAVIFGMQYYNRV